MAVTRDDVARRAGTSTAVVSYVLNNGPRNVSDATRQKVLQAVQELNYRPNDVARALSARNTRTLGLIVPETSNVFFAELSGAIIHAAFEMGYVVLLADSTGLSSREDEYIRLLLEKRVEGLIICGPGVNSDLGRLADSPAHVVVLDRHAPGSPVSSVAIDNYGGAFAATEHLLHHGHSSVACIAGPAYHWAASDRRAGWEAAHRAAGIQPKPADLVETEFSRAGGYYAADELLRRAKRPSAVFVSTDEQAMGALRAAADLGVSVPQELAMFSFDGTSASLFSHPSLSVIQQPLAAMATRTLEILFADRRRTTGFTHDMLPYEVIIRRSCGCPQVPASAFIPEMAASPENRPK
jgi:LacI family transcriptional regulator